MLSLLSTLLLIGVLTFFVAQFFVEHIQAFFLASSDSFINACCSSLSWMIRDRVGRALLVLSQSAYECWMRFIDQVDGFIRQLTVSNVAMDNVAAATIAGSVICTWWCNSNVLSGHAESQWYLQQKARQQHFLETTFQRSIFFDVLAIFSSVVAPTQCNSPRASAGFSIFRRPLRHRLYPRRPWYVIRHKQDDVAFLFGKIVKHAF